jgi:hypothetical protein
MARYEPSVLEPVTLTGSAANRPLVAQARSAAPMTDADLIRFLDAQDQIYQQVVEELARGRKETHWVWFFFRSWQALGEAAWLSTTPYTI